MKSFKLPFGAGRILHTRDNGSAIIFSGQEFATNLIAEHIRKGSVYDRYDLGSGLVTTAGVNLLAADWTNATATLKLANFADSGIGVAVAAIVDVAITTPTGNARIAGVQTNPAAGQYRSAATLSYTAGAAITEYGLYTALTAGTLWDHKVFAAINVISGDSIAFTYTLTCTAGG